MRSTMQETPLLISRLLTHGTTVHGDSSVTTWTAEGPRRTSYAELGRRCARLAHALPALGVTGDERVATFMWNNQQHLEAYLAIPSAGAVLHTLNIRLFPDQLAYIVDHAGDRAVIVDASLAGPFARLLPRLTSVEHVVVNGDPDEEAWEALRGSGRTLHDYEELLAGGPDTYDWPQLDEDSGAAMCYTSGTTGNPRGVVYSHRSNVLHSMQIVAADQFGLSQRDRVLTVVPLFHANAWGIPYGAMLSGCSLVLPDRFLQAAPLAAMIAGEGATKAAAVPTIWGDLLRHLDEEGGDVSSLEEVIVGGSACPPAMIRAYGERHGVRIVHAWGMTETSPLGSIARPPVAAAGAEEFAYRCTQGRIAGLLEFRLVGPTGAVVAQDGAAVGEVQVRGPWITGSYYASEHESDSAFDDGWLRTGDVGSISADGYLTLTDRAKDIIKSGGEWISSVALENALMAHPDVQEASVVGVPDERWGERPLATVVLRPGARAGALAAAGAVGVRRRGAQDVRRQVRQEGDPAAVRGRRPRRHHPRPHARTARRPWPGGRRAQAGVSPNGRPTNDCDRTVRARAMSASTVAAGEPGADSTTGAPASPPSRRRTSSGTSPSRGTGTPSVRLSPAATAAPPPVPKTSTRSPQCGQGSQDMFSMTPATRWRSCWATTPARSATSAAASCGVVTTTTSALGTSCPSEIAMSPVPGGRSSSSTSRSPQ